MWKWNVADFIQNCFDNGNNFRFFLLVFVRLEEILEGENVPRATSDTTRRLRSEVNSSFLWYQYHEIISGLSLSLIKVKLGNCTIPEKYG